MFESFPHPAANALPASLDADSIARLLVDSCPDGLCIIGLNGTILFTNRVFRSCSNQCESDMLGRSYLDLIHPDDLERVTAALRPAFRGKRCRPVAHRKTMPASGTRWWTSTWSPLFNREGLQIGVISRESSLHGRTPAEEVFFHDYSRLEEQLNERTRALRAEAADRRTIEQQLWIKDRAMDTSISAMAMVDLDGRLLYANNAMLELWGVAGKSPLSGADMLNLWDDRNAARRILDMTIGDGSWSGELSAKRADGSLFDVQLSATVIYDAERRAIGVFGSCVDITDRKRAERALRQSEERYRRITEAVTDYIYTVTIDNGGLLRTVNCPVCEAVTGYRADDFDKDPELWIAITPEEDRERVRAHLSRLHGGDDPGPIHHRIRRKDGALRWVNRLPVLHRSGSGAVISYDVLVRDITDRKEAEEALRESEARFRHMADLLPQPLFEYDGRGRITFTNHAAYQMLGYSQQEFEQGVGILDLLLSDDRVRAMEAIEQVLRGAKTYGNEYLIVRRDGSTFPAITFSAPILRAERVAGIRTIVIDITDRVQAEEVLRETALKFHQLAGAISEVFFIKDAATRRTLYISPAYESVWGRSCQSFYESPESFRDSVHPDDRALVADALRRQGDGMPTENEYRIVRPEGSVRWIRSKTFPVRNESGALYRIVGVAEDITERKTADEAMRSHAAQLQALSSRLVDVREAERRSIASELHDEIGQLATGLKLGLDLFARSAAGDGQEQVARLRLMAAELITEVRNLSLGLRPSMLDDLGLLPALTWLFKRFSDQTGIVVNFTHSGIARRFLPDTETVIYRAAQEAVTNAVRHAEVDQVFVEITVDQERIGLIVKDAGRGFIPEQVRSAAKGIGLFGMRERVDSLGGTLSIASAPGAGTSIAIRIPLRERREHDTDHGDHHHPR